ncbi:MAG TPA: DUF2336 domain-containing protein, partial [Nitrospiraceae bacterium]|nr:DUF2336 domain-containing protein [Nitrospiraceae bacterium]
MPAISLLEIEETLKIADPQKRHETLHAVADMFLSVAPTLDDEKVELYDEVLNLLVNTAEQREIATVSQRIAALDNAPRQLVKRFASDDDIEIASPVLAQSPRLTTDDLCEIARSKGNGHMLAMSSRVGLAEPVTDILATRGDHDVARALANNHTAKLSASGIERLLEKGDGIAIGQSLGARGDIPPAILQAARERVSAKAAARSRRAAAAQRLMSDLKQSGGLDEGRILGFANVQKYEEVIASLALLSNLEFAAVENMMHPHRIGGIVLVCKSAGL